MYILEMIEDAGYEGIYTSALCCSMDKIKLDNLSVSLKLDLLNIKKEMSAVHKRFNHKYRTTTFMIELQKITSEIENKYINIMNLGIFENFNSADCIEFEVRVIKEV